MSILRASCLLIPVLLLAGCGSEAASNAPAAGQPAPDDIPVAPDPADIPAAPDPAVLAVLEKADAKDGTVDKIVHKCAGCSLGMNGKEEYSLKVGGYTMHFCNETRCLAAFRDDPSKAILAMKMKD